MVTTVGACLRVVGPPCDVAIVTEAGSREQLNGVQNMCRINFGTAQMVWASSIARAPNYRVEETNGAAG